LIPPPTMGEKKREREKLGAGAYRANGLVRQFRAVFIGLGVSEHIVNRGTKLEWPMFLRSVLTALP
jgi:hypothetical protein